jgi:hypothetical protein
MTGTPTIIVTFEAFGNLIINIVPVPINAIKTRMTIKTLRIERFIRLWDMKAIQSGISKKAKIKK